MLVAFPRERPACWSDTFSSTVLLTSVGRNVLFVAGIVTTRLPRFCPVSIILGLSDWQVAFRLGIRKLLIVELRTLAGY